MCRSSWRFASPPPVTLFDHPRSSHCHLRRIPNASFLGRLEPEIKHPDRRAHEIPIITSARGLQTYHMAPDLLHALAVEWTPRVKEVDDYLENMCPLKAVVCFGKGGRVTCPTRAWLENSDSCLAVGTVSLPPLQTVRRPDLEPAAMEKYTGIDCSGIAARCIIP